MRKKRQLQNFLPIFIIVILTLIAWYRISFQSFSGEGWSYFEKRLAVFDEGGRLMTKDVFFAADSFARLLFPFIIPIFQDNISAYMTFFLFLFILLIVSFYVLVWKITNNKIIGFLATVFWGVNYLGFFTNLAVGQVQFFISRIPNLIPLFAAFYFYVKRNYFLSFGLYFLSIFMSRFGVPLLSLFIFYTVMDILLEQKKLRKIVEGVLFLTPFFLASVLLLNGNQIMAIADNRNFLDFLIHYPNFLELLKKIFFQLTVVTFPFFILQQLGVVKFLITIWSDVFSNSQTIVFGLTPLVVIVYLAATIYVFRKGEKLRKLVFSFLFSSIFCLLVNIYHERMDIFTSWDTDRYFYLPLIGVSFFWATFLFLLLYQKSIFKRLIFLGLVVFWLFFNIKMNFMAFAEVQPRFTASLATIAYVKSLSTDLPDNSLVVLPREMIFHGQEFIERFYGRDKKIKFMTTGDPAWENNQIVILSKFDPEKVSILKYDYNKNKVVDITDEYLNLKP